MKSVGKIFFCVALAIAMCPALAEEAKLNQQQLEQIHKEVCSVAPHKGSGQEKSAWFCDVPRSYRSELPQYFNDNDPSYKKCPLSFNEFGASNSTRIYYGKFTEMEPQALAVYSAACEPHANNGGGTALFRVVDGQFQLIRYYVGMAPIHCVVPPSLQGQLQKPYCISSFVGQGQVSEEFGLLAIDGNGKTSIPPLLSAGNIDAMLGVTATDCPRPDPAVHDFVALDVDSEGNIVLEGRYLSPRSVARACQRFTRKDFSDDETELREMSPVVKSMAFVREGEAVYLKMIAIFGADGKSKSISFTNAAASPERQ